MNIQPLSSTPVPEIVACLLEAFEGYFVPMPTKVAYWERRWRAARVDMAHSWGVFEADRLIAFMMIGVDRRDGQLTAFNTGTGVVPAARGKGWVDHMYAAAIPAFKRSGIERCELEVIQANHRAIRVYERIGFRIKRSLYCYKGSLPTGPDAPALQQVEMASVQLETHYGWDHLPAALHLQASQLETWQVGPQEKPLGYYVSDPLNGQLFHLEAQANQLPAVLSALGSHHEVIKFNNIWEERVDLNQHFQAAGLENPINQYEMEMEI
ncbi:MAG: GNAT family N-acetyltransferase [Bacteroidota bacterium]